MSGRASSAERGSLAARRRLRRRRAFIAACVLSVFAAGAAVYGLWQRPVRISRVVVYGADQSLASVVTAVLRGTYFGIIPRDSAFFVPENDIRARVLSAHPEIAAVSVFRDGLTGLSVRADRRVPIARWCGASRPGIAASAASSTPAAAAAEGCYLFDAQGFVYASMDSTSSPQAPSDAAVNPFSVYEAVATTGSPIGTTLPHADRFPLAFDFARQLSVFGSPASAVVLRGDEADDYLASGTRITYVLGREQDALAALTSARANLDLADGSLEYVDLRFPGKMYVKRK